MQLLGNRALESLEIKARRLKRQQNYLQEEWALKKEELKRRMRSNLSFGQTRDQNSFTPSKNDNVYFDEPCQCKGICVCRYKKAAMMTSDAKAAQSNFEERIKNLKKQIAKKNIVKKWSTHGELVLARRALEITLIFDALI